jgi:hypothetical protein
MPQQDLDGLQVRPGLQQMRGERVAERMRGDPFSEPGLPGRSATEALHGTCRERTPRISGGEEPARGTVPAPVATQMLQEGLRQRHVAIFAAFALADPQEHARTVNVAQLQREGLGQAQPRRIERHDQDAMLEVGDDPQETLDLLAAEHYRESLGLLGKGDVLDHVGLAQTDAVEKAQGTDTLIDLGPGTLLSLDEEELKLADLGRTESIGGLAEVLGEFGNAVDVDLDGPRRIVADREILDHLLA